MFWRRRKRLQEEIEAHLNEEIADNIERGMDRSAPTRLRYGPLEILALLSRKLGKETLCASLA